MTGLGKVQMMSRLGARLTNDRWGWDGVRADGSIIFIGWEDKVVRDREGRIESCRIVEGENPSARSHGGRERIRHVNELLAADSVGYLVIATAKDINARTREIIGIDDLLHSVRLERIGPIVYAIPVGSNSAPDVPCESETSRIDEILSSTDIPETEKHQLVRARRGQGLFRRRVELIERGCRVTGVADRAYLRAGHIKPWRLSTNSERLDGNNGLLLSPHIDYLFDQGFISFADEGHVLISHSLSSDVLKAWSIDIAATSGPFNAKQRGYLDFHRTRIFRSPAPSS